MPLNARVIKKKDRITSFPSQSKARQNVKLLEWLIWEFRLFALLIRRHDNEANQTRFIIIWLVTARHVDVDVEVNLETIKNPQPSCRAVTPTHSQIISFDKPVLSSLRQIWWSVHYSSLICYLAQVLSLLTTPRTRSAPFLASYQVKGSCRSH